MHNIFSIAMKDLLLMWRDKFSIFWILAFPLIFALFFGLIFSGSGSGSAMRVAVVDLDSSDTSHALVRSLEESAAVKVVTPAEDAPWTRSNAREVVRKGAVVAYVLIPPGYGDGGSAAMFVPDSPALEVGIDPVRKAAQGMLAAVLAEASFKRMETMVSDPVSMRSDIEQFREDLLDAEDTSSLKRTALLGLFDSLEKLSLSTEALNQAESEQGNTAQDTSAKFNPVKIDFSEITRPGAEPASAFEISFPQAIVWGLIGCAAGFAITLVQEKTLGTWIRLRVAPQSLWQVLAGKGLACFLACVGTVVLLIAIGNLLFSIRIASPVAFVLATVSIGVCFTGMMMVIATLGRTERAVAGAGWAAMMPLAMIGGGMVPLIAMPSWMVTVSNVSPVKWSVLAMEGAIWRGFSLVEMVLPCAVLVSVGALCFGVGALILSKREA